MILSHIQLTNYKQYAGEHDIAIPTEATVGVIGANGVGKTTLFEAIEWCLYNPSTIPSKDVRPRGRGGMTKVVVTLDMPGTDQQYLVERELKRSSTQAVIYRVEPDGEETIIVQGTKQVTEHIEKKLIGLNHSAFTATFFTRQKELSFFGDLGATARRREVGKLLGLETIRAAQQNISADRNTALSESRVLKARYEAESQGRDFTVEIVAAEKTIDNSRKELATAHESVDKAREALASAERNLNEQQILKDRETAVAQRLLTLRGELGKASERQEHFEKELARIAGRENERASLLTIAQRTDILRAEDERLDGQRKLAMQKRELEQSRTANDQRRTDTIASIQSTVSKLVPPAALDGWDWSNADHDDADTGCERLLVAIDRIDIPLHERTARDLESLRTLGRDHEEARKRLALYEERRTNLDKELKELVKSGNPSTRLSDIAKHISELQGQEVNIRSGITLVMSQREQITGLSSKLQEQQFGDKCPTCHRAFTPDDMQVTLQAFQTQVRDFNTQLHELNRDLTNRHEELGALQVEHTSLEKHSEHLASVRQRIDASVPYIDEQKQTTEKLSTRFTRSLEELGREALPTDDDINRVGLQLQAWSRIVDTRGTIERSHATISVIAAEMATLERQIKEIGEVEYDEAVHNTIRTEHRQAFHAQTTIVQIDQDIARRPQIESDLTACKEHNSATCGSIETAEKERNDIGFEPDKLAVSTSALREVRESESIATELRHRVQSTLRDAEHVREALLKDQERISKLATDADTKQREHDQLDQMYREFTEFERFAAAWYAPRLSDITSELVSEVTDGKYDRVVFDNNFGIDIYDGEEEKFALETFSGGERDVIALCARIALSRVIGGQGAHPPGFLVLDEVFGSLDRDRRSRLLEMLGAITSSGEHFRQIFMISHVDDVRTAPIFDDLWLVTETAEGTSELQSLSPGADIGEI